MKRFESLIFDFDGTLAELRLDFDVMKRRVGLLARDYLDGPAPPLTVPALEWVESVVAVLQTSNPPAAEAFQVKAEAIIVEMEIEAAHAGCLFPFTRPLLHDLRRRGLKTAIITRNCERAVRVVFPDIDAHCSSFLSREHVPRVKPDPVHLLQALRKVAGRPETALMVGDHPIDIQTGRHAGVLTAGVWSGKASQADLIESGAHWTARNCEELIRALQEERLL